MARTNCYQRKHLDANTIATAMRDLYRVLKDDIQQNATASSIYVYIHTYICTLNRKNFKIQQAV